MKSKLTPELLEQIVQYIKVGNYNKDACQAVGISERVYYKWLKRGEKALKLEEKGNKIPKKEEIYVQFVQSIKKAKAKAVIRNVLVIQTAAKKSWQAAAWWLERSHHKDWGIKKQIGGIGEEPLPVPTVTVVIDTKKQSLEVKKIDKEVKAIDIKSIDKKD